MGLPFLLYSAAGALQKWRLYIYGQHSNKAKLISMAPIGTFFIPFVKSRFEIHYSFQNSVGQDVFGKSTISDLVLINEKKKGDEIDILYLPNDEKKSCVVDETIMLKIRQAT